MPFVSFIVLNRTDGRTPGPFMVPVTAIAGVVPTSTDYPDGSSRVLLNTQGVEYSWLGLSAVITVAESFGQIQASLDAIGYEIAVPVRTVRPVQRGGLGE